MEQDKVREAIKLAAQGLFRKYGYHKTSVNEIAVKARVAKATIYKYFESKELILNEIIMDYLQKSIAELLKGKKDTANEEWFANLIRKTCRLSYTVCNEFIGWDFIRESTNAQGFLKNLSDELEVMLLNAFRNVSKVSPDEDDLRRLSFLIKSSKSIVFSFAFISVSDADVRKNFISFEKEILPYLIKGSLK